MPGDVAIPGSSFLLGASPSAPFVFDNEKWAHPVTVSPFEIARAPVTQSEFATFVDDRAETALDSAVGPDPDIGTLEEISSMLEAEGAYRLAQRYREKAFYKSLGLESKESGEETGGSMLSG